MPEKKLVQVHASRKGGVGELKVLESKCYTDVHNAADAVSHTPSDGRRVKFERVGGGKMEATKKNFINKDAAVMKAPPRTHTLHTYTRMHLHSDEWEV